MSHRPRTTCYGLALAATLFCNTQLSWADDESTVVRLSEPVASTETHETFGAEIPETVQPLSLAALIAEPEKFADQSVVVTARVAQVCQKKGCFFIAQDGETTVRVSFVDYSFFVPTDIGGRRVTILGELKRVELTEKQAAHLEEDLGSVEANIAPGPQFEIVAASVRVPKN